MIAEMVDVGGGGGGVGLLQPRAKQYQDCRLQTVDSYLSAVGVPRGGGGRDLGFGA
jgi:hypothetical protein